MYLKPQQLKLQVKCNMTPRLFSVAYSNITCPTLIGSLHFSQGNGNKKKVWGSANSHLYKWIVILFSFVECALAE
jgi:hypothetical protein